MAELETPPEIIHVFSFSEDVIEIFSKKDLLKTKEALNKLLLLPKCNVVRLEGLTVLGDIFLVRVGRLPAIKKERDQHRICRLGYIDRRDKTDGKNFFEFGIWKVVPNMGSDVFAEYW